MCRDSQWSASQADSERPYGLQSQPPRDQYIADCGLRQKMQNVNNKCTRQAEVCKIKIPIKLNANTVLEQ